MPTRDTDNYKKLNETVKWQNDILREQQKTQNDTYSTDNQKIKYQTVNINFYYAINQILWWVYYIVALGVLFCLFFGKTSEYSIIYKRFLAILVILFPYIIIPIESYLYWLLGYFYAVINKSVYNKPTFDLPVITLTTYK